MKPMNMTSNLSNRVKIRRNAFSLLKNRSTSLHFLYSSRSYSQGVFALDLGGITGLKPLSFTSFRVAAPPYDLSIIILQSSWKVFPVCNELASFRHIVMHCLEKWRILAHNRHSQQPDEFWWYILPWIPQLLGAPLFKAPVPSGCTLTKVLSRETVSILV